MRLYLRVRAMRHVGMVALATLLFLAWPGSSLNATPSPTGATMMLGVFVALAVPVVVGWACGRGDERLELSAVRPVRRSDVVYAVGVCTVVALLAASLHTIGLADAGLAAARATFAFLGLLLLAAAWRGWRLAPIVPALFLLAVAVFGRGADNIHAAPWAFIAASDTDLASWGVAVSAVVAGVAAAFALPHQPSLSADE